MKFIKHIIFLLFALCSSVGATSVSTEIFPTLYTPIPTNSGGAFSATAFLQSQCLFSATQPSASAVGARILQGETWSIGSTSLALWCKSDGSANGKNWIVTTVGGNASINGAGLATRAFTPTATYSSIALADTDQTILAANANRRGVVISVTPNSPDGITVNTAGGIVYDSVNADYSGITIPVGGSIILDSSMSNSAFTAASPTAGARYQITELTVN